MKLHANLLLAAIDIGSSAIRMDVAEARPDGSIRVLDSLKKGVQLGREAFTQGRLSQEAIQAACDALRDFKKVLDTYGVSSYRAVATSAVRESTNSETFLDRLLISSGLDVEVINGPEENRLTLLVVMNSIREAPDLAQGKCLLVEVGGGSTDVSLIKEGGLLQSGTFPLGSIRLSADAGAGLYRHEQQVQMLKNLISGQLFNIKREIRFRDSNHYIALGGDVRFVTRLLNGSRISENLVSIPRKDFTNLVDNLSRFTIDELVQKYSISYLDAETLVPALLTYQHFFAETAADEIIVCDASIRAGILKDMAPSEQDESYKKLTSQILSAARSLGRKYNYDEMHAERVRKMAVTLFNELKTEQHLTETHQLYLETASLLHDIGLFVSSRAHHKHSYYLISSSELFGLRKQEMEIIANIARYHRRALPQRSHIPFISLDRDERVVVSKLSAILRVANALDKDHLKVMVDLKVIRETDQIALLVPKLSDMAMARLSLADRSNLFVEVFGKNIILREMDGAS